MHLRTITRLIAGLGVVLLSCSAHRAQAQPVNVSVSNSLRYGSGSENVGEGGFVSEQRKEYLENMADARLFFDRMTLGFRLDISEPPEYGTPFRGLRKRFIELTQGPVELRAGDIYDLFGRGVSLNLFENRALGFDNGLDGIRFRYRSSLFHATILGGTINFIEPLSLALGPVYEERQRLRAGFFEFRPLKEFRFGGSFVWAKIMYPTLFPGDEDTSISKVPEFFATVKLGSFDLYTSYAFRNSAINGADSVDGSACYAALSHTGEGYGLTFEYKDYRFDVVDPIERSIQYRPTRMPGFHNPPTVHKEHSFTLLSRYPHVVDFNDEVGMQIDAYYSPSPVITLNVNGALSSRHYAFELDRSTFAAVRKEKGAPWLPALDGERSPFWEIYVDAEWYYLGQDQPESYVKLGVNRRAETTYELFHPTSPMQPFRMTALPIQVLHVLSDEWSVKATTEHQWVSAFSSPENHTYYNHLLAISVSRSPDLTIGFRFEHTTNDREPNGTKQWAVGEAGYRIGSNHLLTLAYGSERGGQVCSSGICRIVYPFNGVRFSILSNF